MKNPRVCIVTPDFPGPITNGGVGSACLGYAKVLVDLGYYVDILFAGPTQNGSTSHWTRYYGTEYGLNYIDLGEWCAKNLRQSPPFFLKEEPLLISEKILNYFRSNNLYSIIFCQDYLGNGFRLLQAKTTTREFDSTNVVIITHSCTKWIREGMCTLPYYPAESIISYMEQVCIRLADWVMHPCNYMKDWISANFLRPERESVVPYQTTLHSVSKIYSKRTRAGQIDIVFFGRLETRKGLSILLDALRLTRNTNTIRSAHFLGKSAKLNGYDAIPQIERALSESAIDNHTVQTDLDTESALKFVGSLDNPLVVLPSLVDNMPLAIMELFERDYPIIVSNVGGIPEIVGEANDQIVFSPQAQPLFELIVKIAKGGYPSINRDSGYSAIKSKMALVGFLDQMTNPERREAEVISVADRGKLSLSIVIAHKDNDAGLIRVIEKLLPQMTACDEIIIVDDASDHEVRHRIQSGPYYKHKQVSYVFLPQNVKPARARNIGAAAARNTHLLFFDSDNTPGPTLLDTFRTGLSVAKFRLITSYNQAADSSKVDEPDSATIHAMVYNPLGGCLIEGLVNNTFGDVVFAIHRPLFHELGGFNAESCVEDWGFLLRAHLKGHSIGIIPSVTYYYAVRPDSYGASFNHSDKLRALVKELSLNFDCRIPGDLYLLFEVLQGLRLPIMRATQEGNSLYDSLSNLDESYLLLYRDAADLQIESSINTQVFARIRGQLLRQLRDLSVEAKVGIFGAGKHTKALLFLCPELLSFKLSFYQSYGASTFLGERVKTLEELERSPPDVLVFSSRDFEVEMYESAKHVLTRHVTLYNNIG